MAIIIDESFSDDDFILDKVEQKRFGSADVARLKVEAINLKDGNKVGQEVTHYIYPSSSKQFSYTVGIDKENIDTCQYLAKVIPTRTDCETVTKYKDVTKTRQVTDYKTVTKTRTITKYRTETICE